MSWEYDKLRTTSTLSLSNDDPVYVDKNGIRKSKRNVFRSHSMPQGAKRPSYGRGTTSKSNKYKSLGFLQTSDQTRVSAKDSKSSEDYVASREVLNLIERMMKYFRALPFFMIIEKAKVIKALQDVKERLTSANGRVKQHEAKLRRILYKLGQLDSDVYDLHDPDEVHLLHQNWKDLYDEIEWWLGGPEAAMTSDSSSDTDDDRDQRKSLTKFA